MTIPTHRAQVPGGIVLDVMVEVGHFQVAEPPPPAGVADADGNTSYVTAPVMIDAALPLTFAATLGAVEDPETQGRPAAPEPTT